jgi:Endosomal/lysosomal potassium channel TMEM175
MPVSYNKITGQSVERLAALSDGVFAVAMTLLLLELHTPAQDVIHSESDLLHAMAAFWPQLAVYLMRLPDAGNFLDGPANTTELSAAIRPKPELAAPGISFCGDPDAGVDAVFDGVCAMPLGAAGVLGEHLVARGHFVPELGLRDARTFDQRRNSAEGAVSDLPADRGGTSALCIWGVVMCVQ